MGRKKREESNRPFWKRRREKEELKPFGYWDLLLYPRVSPFMPHPGPAIKAAEWIKPRIAGNSEMASCKSEGGKAGLRDPRHPMQPKLQCPPSGSQAPPRGLAPAQEASSNLSPFSQKNSFDKITETAGAKTKQAWPLPSPPHHTTPAASGASKGLSSGQGVQ